MDSNKSIELEPVSEQEIDKIFEGIWMNGTPFLTGRHIVGQAQASHRAFTELLSGNLDPFATYILEHILKLDGNSTFDDIAGLDRELAPGTMEARDNAIESSWRLMLHELAILIIGDSSTGMRIELVKDTDKFPGANKTPAARITAMREDAVIYSQMQQLRDKGMTYTQARNYLVDHLAKSERVVEKAYGRASKAIKQSDENRRRLEDEAS